MKISEAAALKINFLRQLFFIAGVLRCYFYSGIGSMHLSPQNHEISHLPILSDISHSYGDCICFLAISYLHGKADH